VWRDEPEPPPPPYNGPVAEIRPDGVLYVVSVEPRLPNGDGEPLSYGSKHEAWGQMLAWAHQYRLPVRDLTNGKVGPKS
jgi:hypothetical protein